MKKIIWIIILIIVIFAGWYFLSPLFINQEVDEELPESFVLPTPEEFAQMSDIEKKKMEMAMIEEFSNKGNEVDEEMPSGPSILSSGNFVDADNFHKGEGIVKIIQFDNQLILRLEEFMVTNGPDLRVLLSTETNPTDDNLGEYIELGKLKGNKGNQNYVIEGISELGKYQSVVIYCKPFHVVFSTAELK